MSAEQHHGTRPEAPAASSPPPGSPAARDEDERADMTEDRRRQRELDDAELGGEA